MAVTGASRLYEREDGRLQSAYIDSELDKVLAADPSWSVIEPKPQAPAPKPKAAAPKAAAKK